MKRRLFWVSVQVTVAVPQTLAEEVKGNTSFTDFYAALMPRVIFGLQFHNNIIMV